MIKPTSTIILDHLIFLQLDFVYNTYNKTKDCMKNSTTQATL